MASIVERRVCHTGGGVVIGGDIFLSGCRESA